MESNWQLPTWRCKQCRVGKTPYNLHPLRVWASDHSVTRRRLGNKLLLFRTIPLFGGKHGRQWSTRALHIINNGRHIFSWSSRVIQLNCRDAKNALAVHQVKESKGDSPIMNYSETHILFWETGERARAYALQCDTVYMVDHHVMVVTCCTKSTTFHQRRAKSRTNDRSAQCGTELLLTVSLTCCMSFQAQFKWCLEGLWRRHLLCGWLQDHVSGCLSRRKHSVNITSSSYLLQSLSLLHFPVYSVHFTLWHHGYFNWERV